MKSFSFKLETALRWRGMQVNLEQHRVAVAAARLDSIRAGIDGRRKDLATGAASLTQGSAGDALQSWAAWEKKCVREIAELERHALDAEQYLGAILKSLLQANRNKELILKLRASAFSDWQKEVDRDIEAFAGEAFLRRVTIEKRTGA